MLLLHVFPEDQFVSEIDPSHQDTEIHTEKGVKRFHGIAENFYIVLMLKSSTEECRQKSIVIRTWKISFTANLLSVSEGNKLWITSKAIPFFYYLVLFLVYYSYIGNFLFRIICNYSRISRVLFKFHLRLSMYFSSTCSSQHSGYYFRFVGIWQWHSGCEGKWFQDNRRPFVVCKCSLFHYAITSESFIYMNIATAGFEIWNESEV